MTWGSGMNMNDAPCVHDYASALRVWNNSTPWKAISTTPEWRRKDADYERPLSRALRNHKHKSIINRGGAIAFKLYSTNLVTYYPDGHIQLDPYSSTSSDDFVDRFLPNWIRTHFAMGAISVLQKGALDAWKTGRYYQACKALHLRRTDGEYPWEVIDPQPWERRHVDREKMRVACEKWGYDLFRDTCHTYFGLQHHTGRAFDMPRTGRNESVMDILKAGPVAWGAFMTTPDPNPRRRAFDDRPPFTLDTILKKLRTAICLHTQAYTIEEMPYVVGYQVWQHLRFTEF